MKLIINWTPEKEQEMKKLVEDFLRRHGAHSGEHVCQCDDCQIYAPILVGMLADLIVDDTEWE